jgi:hypothetical protein
MKCSSTGAKIPLGPYLYNDQKRRQMMNEIFNFLQWKQRRTWNS